MLGSRLHPFSSSIALQLTRLTNLRALQAVRCGPDCAEAVSRVTLLPRLESLQLEEITPLLPEWLPGLTQLRQLALSGELQMPEEPGDAAEAAAAEAEATAQLDAALAPLTQLTCLVLGTFPLAALPQAVAALPLQRLLAHTIFPEQAAEGLPCPAPMLASLSWVGMPWQVGRGVFLWQAVMGGPAC